MLKSDKKMVPLVGGLVGDGFDLVDTKVIANRAYKWFFENDFSCKDDKNNVDDEIIIEESDFAENAE